MTTEDDPSIEELQALWGRRVSAERTRLGLTQEQLAERCELSQATISAIELGVYGGRPRTRLAIARALGVPGLFSYDVLAEEAS